MTLDGANLGIGITNPGSPLQIVDSSDASIRIYDSTGATGDLSSSGWKFRALAGNAATNANGLQISHGTTERIHITTDGEVQITGADDQNNLLVKGGSTHFAVHQDDTDGEVSLRAQDGSGNNYSKFMTFFTHPSGSPATERLRIGSSGQIGIAGANYGTSGQVLTSQGSGSAVQWATPSSGAMTLLATMNINMGANTVSQSLTLTGYQKLMGTVTSLQRSGGLNDVWFGFNNMTSSGNYSWYRSYLDNSNDTSAQHSANGTGYAYGSVGPGFFYNLAGIAGFDSGNNDGEFTLHNLQDGGRKIFTMTARGYLTRNMVINTSGSVEQTAAITSFQVNVAQSSHRLTGGTIKLYGFK